VEVRDIFKV